LTNQNPNERVFVFQMQNYYNNIYCLALNHGLFIITGSCNRYCECYGKHYLLASC